VHDELKSRGKKQRNGSVIKISEEGVLFRSYRDGSPVFLTPESSVAAQQQLGADIIIPLDELPPYHIDAAVLKKSVERTHRWELRSLQAHKSLATNQAMYSVVHGGLDKTLRLISCEFAQAHPFDGYAIGGSMGKTREQMYEMLDYTVPSLRPDKPRHLLGIGDTASCLEVVKRGIDTFDSAYPTKCARHGLFLKADGTFVKITNAQFKTLHEPIDKKCECSTCQRYTAAYLHHLFKVHELVALSAATIHNLHTMLHLTRTMREAILEDRL
jgi:queuine tRNA-ribosyltransferase